MSAKQTGLVWELDLPHNEAWVLMAMADHADHEGHNVYPGVPLLAWKTGYTTRQVRRILAVLQEKGLIVVETPGGGRRTTRYRLELGRAAKKDPRRPVDMHSDKRPKTPEMRSDKMSPPQTGSSRSPQPGQNVRGDRTGLCHSNRQGRKGTESSEPPPSNLPPRAASGAIASPPATGEGGRELQSEDGRKGEDRHPDGAVVEKLRTVCASWAAHEHVPTARLGLFQRQAERLATGQDAEAWTHPQNGAVVAPEDRLRILTLGLRHLADGTSHTLRGGVMYAVAKHYRSPPPVPGTEHATVVARATFADGAERSRTGVGHATTLTVVGNVLSGQIAHPVSEKDPVEEWERMHTEECESLRAAVTRELAAAAGQRQISDRMLRAIGKSDYRRRVLQRLQCTDTQVQRQ